MDGGDAELMPGSSAPRLRRRSRGVFGCGARSPLTRAHGGTIGKQFAFWVVLMKCNCPWARCACNAQLSPACAGAAFVISFMTEGWPENDGPCGLPRSSRSSHLWEVCHEVRSSSVERPVISVGSEPA